MIRPDPLGAAAPAWCSTQCEPIADSVTDRPHWLEVRDSLIGASEAATVLGHGGFSTPFKLYSLKAGLVPPEEATEAMLWGLRFEEAIAQAYAETTKRDVRRHEAPEMDGDVFRFPSTSGLLLRSKDHPFMGATPDGEQVESGSRGLLEIKNVSYWVGKDWLDDGEPRTDTLVQAQQQLAVTGADWITVAACTGGQKLIWFDIERRNDVIEILVNETGEFWERVEKSDPPPVDYESDDDQAVVRRLFEEDGSETILPPESTAWLAARDKLKTAEKKIKTALGVVETKIVEAIGASSIATVPEREDVLIKFKAPKAGPKYTCEGCGHAPLKKSSRRLYFGKPKAPKAEKKG